MENDTRNEVKIATDTYVKEEIYRFRYFIYVEEMGKKPKGMDEEKRMLYDDLDESATLLYIENDSRIIATLRVNHGQKSPLQETLNQKFNLSQFENYSNTQFSFSSRLMIAPEWRGTNILAPLLLKGYQLARENGVVFDFCHCRPALVPIYEHLGYRRFKDNFTDPESGYQIPLVLVTDDYVYLKEIRSFFAMDARKRKNATFNARWFSEHFQQNRTVLPDRFQDPDDFWRYLTERLHYHDIQLFSRLDELEIQHFIKFGNILTCKKGDVLIRTGDVGNEMFVLLSGVVEVVGHKDNKTYTLANFEKGELFGEMAFISSAPRTADVVALTDLEVLVLTQKNMEKAIKTMPDISCRILMNLSLVLCERLRISTQNWMEAIKNNHQTTFVEMQ